MPVIHDGMNTYTMRNGKMVLVSPEHETMGANGQTVYDYTGASGVLKLNPTMIPEGALEQMAQAVERHKEKGIEVRLAVGPLGEKIFPGVKRIIPLSPEEMKYESRNPDC
ncbi:MAG: hypothetical protein AABX91_01515 [Nanoarchaeota archaeon]